MQVRQPACRKEPMRVLGHPLVADLYRVVASRLLSLIPRIAVSKYCRAVLMPSMPLSMNLKFGEVNFLHHKMIIINVLRNG